MSLGLLTLKCLFLIDGDHLVFVSNSQSKQLSDYLLIRKHVELHFERMSVNR